MTPTEACERVTNSRRWHVWAPIAGAVLGALIAGVFAPIGGRILDDAEDSGQLQNRVTNVEARVEEIEGTVYDYLRSIDQRLSRIEGRLGDRDADQP